MEQKIKIEKNVKRLRGSGTRDGENHYPFSDMEVGDSFVVEIGERKPASVQASMSTVARFWAAYHKKDWKFSLSMISDKGKVRIWRTK